MKTKLAVIMALHLALWAVVGASEVRTDANSLENLEAELTGKMDELMGKERIEIYGDMLTLEKIADVREEESVEKDEDPLVSRVTRFLRNRKLQVNFPNDGSSADIFGRAVGQKSVGVELRALTEGASEARTKLKKIMLPVMLALGAKMWLVLPIVIFLIGLTGVMGIQAGFLSLLLSAAVALKAIYPAPPPYPARISYGIVRPHDIHHEHWHRSQEEVNQPYRGWAPEYNAEQFSFQDVP